MPGEGKQEIGDIHQDLKALAEIYDIEEYASEEELWSLVLKKWLDDKDGSGLSVLNLFKVNYGSDAALAHPTNTINAHVLNLGNDFIARLFKYLTEKLPGGCPYTHFFISQMSLKHHEQDFNRFQMTPAMLELFSGDLPFFKEIQLLDSALTDRNVLTQLLKILPNLQAKKIKRFTLTINVNDENAQIVDDFLQEVLKSVQANKITFEIDFKLSKESHIYDLYIQIQNEIAKNRREVFFTEVDGSEKKAYRKTASQGNIRRAGKSKISIRAELETEVNHQEQEEQLEEQQQEQTQETSANALSDFSDLQIISAKGLISKQDLTSTGNAELKRLESELHSVPPKIIQQFWETVFGKESGPKKEYSLHS